MKRLLCWLGIHGSLEVLNDGRKYCTWCKGCEVTDQERYDDLVNSLTNHAPDEDQLQRILAVREMAKDLGHQICFTVQDSRARAIALTHLEDCTMWTVKAIVLE